MPTKYHVVGHNNDLNKVWLASGSLQSRKHSLFNVHLLGSPLLIHSNKVLRNGTRQMGALPSGTLPPGDYLSIIQRAAVIPKPTLDSESLRAGLES